MKLSIMLIVGSNDSTPEQEAYRQKLEREAQSWWDRFYSSITDKDAPFPPALSAFLSAGWLAGVTHGRKIRFLLETIGEKVRKIDTASAEEVNGLIGTGKTLETLISAFESAEFVDECRAPHA